MYIYIYIIPSIATYQPKPMGKKHRCFWVSFGIWHSSSQNPSEALESEIHPLPMGLKGQTQRAAPGIAQMALTWQVMDSPWNLGEVHWSSPWNMGIQPSNIPTLEIFSMKNGVLTIKNGCLNHQTWRFKHETCWYMVVKVIKNEGVCHEQLGLNMVET